MCQSKRGSRQLTLATAGETLLQSMIENDGANRVSRQCFSIPGSTPFPGLVNVCRGSRESIRTHPR